MAIDRRSVRVLVRAIAYDVRGTRLGRVAQVFLDDRSDEPAWVAVDVTRTRGMRLLPLAGAALKGRHLVIRAERSTVRSAPRIDLGDGQLSSQDEARLLEHYGLAPSAGSDSSGGEHRPASPWPDDTERETAWERPQRHDRQDTQPLGQGWNQSPGAAGGVGDQVPNRDMPQPVAEQPSTGLHSDTAPSPVTEGPPARATAPPTPGQASGASTPPVAAEGGPSVRPADAGDRSEPHPEAGTAAR